MGRACLTELPSAPLGKKGWPWTEDCSGPFPGAGNEDWPRISIVTPSFNQAAFLEETIRSVLLQDYPDVEYIIVDGGSTDGSVEIIRKYERWLTYWVSEPDRGQCHAINKGWAHATGKIWAWLNSDDTYLPNAFDRVVGCMRRHPGTQLVYGSARFVDASGGLLNIYRGRSTGGPVNMMKYWEGWHIPQPTVFFDRELVRAFGDLDETYQYALDYEWLIRIGRSVPFLCIEEELATYRLHQDSKTGDWNATRCLFWGEAERVNRAHAPMWNPRYWPLWCADALRRLRDWRTS